MHALLVGPCMLRTFVATDAAVHVVSHDADHGFVRFTGCAGC